ncbi:amidase domain-containing protein [Paenibacillus sanfengchensis]|uniref:amidase domain-containing protein n=1 Tax=Paenibacillus sanfengchensis TaxID=3119819 RepID=UPI002FDF6A3C
MLKKLLPMVIAVVMVLGMSTSVIASKLNTSDQSNIFETKFVEMAYNEIKEQILTDYQKFYKVDNFDYDFELRSDNEYKYFDINIYVDMALTRHPSDSPFVQGMEKALKESSDKAEKEMLQGEIDAYVNEIESLYYNIPNRSTFTYTIRFDNSTHLIADDSTSAYQIYYRTDTDDGIILTENNKLADVENPTTEFRDGYNMRESVDLSHSATNSLLASFTYDRIAARDWARDNYDAAPEYPSKDVPGTDCANFVSKAINNGGILQDKQGKWYQAATWGGWPGDHWFRTGYNKKTGVVIYMTDKGYFYKESKESTVNAGSIMYWNNKSHVALVTYGDGITIKYTEHGARQTKDTVYRTIDDASFYKPSSSILK